MLLIRSFIATFAAGIILAASVPAAQTRTTAGLKTGYAPVNGLNLYYEIHGTGKPLILLHGGLGANEMFDEVMPALSKGRQVIAVDLQAHGRTGDIDRPLSYDATADDIAALIKHLGIKKADVMGYSVGGGIALRTAVRHPEVSSVICKALEGITVVSIGLPLLIICSPPLCVVAFNEIRIRIL
jgi:pimeloyl-ACP methyl ester carboxylesterase